MYCKECGIRIQTNQEYCNDCLVDVLKEKLTKATKRIEDMKCCGNCSYLYYRDCNNKKSDLYKDYPQPDDKCQYWKQSNR